MSKEIEESAKAVQEVAKLGQKSIEAGSEAGRYLSKYFSGGLEHLGAAFHDWAAGYRVGNWLKIMKKTDDLLEAAGFERSFHKISSRNAIPLIEAISLECDEDIQELWAKLVSNAANPNRSDAPLSRVLIEALRRLEPIDVAIIEKFIEQDIESESVEVISLGKEALKPLSLEQAMPSLTRLSAVGLLVYDNQNGSLWAGNEAMACQVEVSTNLGSFRPTYLMIELKIALAS